MFDVIYLTNHAKDSIRKEVGENPTVETGGALIGYYTDQSVVITHASGPGPRSVKTKTSVLIDGEYTTKFCGHFQSLSEGRLYYIGDWHIHLWNDLRPSTVDRSAISTILKENKTLTYPLLSVIYYKDLSAVKGYQVSNKLRFRETQIMNCTNPVCINPYQVE